MNVGDSRAYLFRDGDLEQLTTDHSVAEELVARGELTPDEAAQHPQRHILTRALGVAPFVEVDAWELVPQVGDRYLLCSDGLSNEVDAGRIAGILGSDDTPAKAAEDLVSVANEEGGNDNITVVVLDILASEGSDRLLAGAESLPNGQSAGPGPRPVPLTRSAMLVGSPVRRSATSTVDATPGARSRTEHDDAGAAGGVLLDALPVGETKVRREDRAVSSRRRRDPSADRRPRLITGRLVVFLLAVAAVLAGAWGLIRWYLDTSYFLTVQGSQIVVDQGKPGGFLWFQPKTVDRTGVTTAEVPANQVQGLVSGSYSESSPAAARALVRRMVITECEYDQGVYGATTTTAPPAGLPAIARCPTAQKAVVTSPPTTLPPPTTTSKPSSTSSTAARSRGAGPTTTVSRRGDGIMARRIRWLGVAMIVCFCALLIQLDNIQGLKANQYQNAARNPRTIEDEYAKPRGIIVSSDGVVLASSQPTPSSAYYKYQRVYPTGSLFSQVVGFTSYRFGTFTGVEAEYDSELKFRTQPFRDLGDLISTEQGTDTVVLTLSDKLQMLAQQALGNDDGSVVVLDPSNGNVLAMYSNPSFDPSSLASQIPAVEGAGWTAYNARDPHGYVSGLPMAFDSGFPPGSTFKVITSSAAYDHDPQLANMSFPYRATYQPPGTNLFIHNAEPGPCGGTLQQMLPPSCDTGYALLGTDLGAANLVDEAAAFGFGARPPIDLPTNPSAVSCVTLTLTTPCMSAIALEENEPFVAYSAIGQGDVLATPLEMAMVASGIADDGVIMKPHVMARILDPKDNVVQTYQPAEWLRATSPQTAQSVSSLMQGVVSEPNGTAYGIFPSAWQVAAKTGTAQVGQGNTATTDWMIAFAPASHPEVAIAVVVPDQAKSASGATVSGPIVRTVLNGLFGGNG